MGCNTDLRFQVLVPLPCRGLELCSRRYLLGLAHRKARAARQRERRPFAAASRCNFGEPVQLRRAGATSIVGKDFLPAIALEEPVVGQGHGRFAITGRYSCATDLPDVSKCFRRDSSRHPCQRPPCYFAWGCFRYFGWKRETGLSRARHEPAIGATKSTRLVGLRRSLASILACLSARTRRHRLSVTGRQDLSDSGCRRMVETHIENMAPAASPASYAPRR
jgi:hypothetical protein